MHTTLFQFTYSHFNEKARWALDFKRVPHARKSLVPGLHVAKVKRMTGQSAVPVLTLDGKVVFDSTRVIEALERRYPDPALYPAVIAASLLRCRRLRAERWATSIQCRIEFAISSASSSFAVRMSSPGCATSSAVI